MPLKSKAQRRKFAQLLVEGKVTPETFEEWNRSTGTKELPERLHPKEKAEPKRKKAANKSARKSATRKPVKKAKTTARTTRKRR